MLHDTSNPTRCGHIGTMKRPRLPGAEKFKFSNTVNSVTSINNVTTSGTITPKIKTSLSLPETENVLSPKSKSPYPARLPSRYSQGDLSPLVPTLSVTSLNRNDNRRKAVLPITCKKTSRMLNNTNMELNLDHAELISENDIKNGRLNLGSSRIPSCPNLESSESLNSSKTSLDAYFRKLSLQNPPIQETAVDWMNIRATPSRLSASCSSSCSSEENVWVLRENAS